MKAIAANFPRGARPPLAEAWRNLADTVLGELNQKWPFAPPDWASRWNEQVENYFEIRTAVLPWREASDEVIGRLIAGEDGFDKAFPDVAAVRRLADAIPAGETPGYSQKSAGNWQAKVELSARLMQAQRSIRHVPPSTEVKHEGEEFPPKCSLLGSYEQMGPAGLQQSAEFWQQAARQLSIGGVRLHERERFSAVALIGFSGPGSLSAGKLGLSPTTCYDDTAPSRRRVADRAGIDHESVAASRAVWSGQWLHWQDPISIPTNPPG